MAVASRRLIYRLFTTHGMTTLQKQVAREVPLKVYVNGGELITTPQNLGGLALGFLYLEGLIHGLDEVADLQLRDDEGTVHVRLTRDLELPTRRLLLRGCGGGSTFTGPSLQTDKVASSLR
jgi:formate dehydrogenase accessory protein FdhD